jgi:hypothetical protein
LRLGLVSSGRHLEQACRNCFRVTQKHLFDKIIDWPEAVEMREASDVSFSDSMILNAFQCSRCPFIVSRDFDIGYAVLADAQLKDAVMSDRMARKYRLGSGDQRSF